MTNLGVSNRGKATGSGEGTRPDAYPRGEFINLVSAAAYAGRIDHRTFLGALLTAGVAATTATAWADHATQASENQGRRRAALQLGYDYIIVGAGSAGCVLANRLSADPSALVLLIEAGPDDLNLPQITDPSLWPTNLGSPLDWALPSTPQDDLADRSLTLSAGRVVGGSGSINAMVWLRGDARDYAGWANAGGPTWGFGPVLRAFKKIESFHGAGGRLRGSSGPIPVETPANEHPLTPLYLVAAEEELGLHHVSLNGRPLIDGTDVTESNIENGRRVGPAQAYLQPVLARPNLTLLPQTEVVGLLLEAGRCRGISAIHGGHRHDFEAARDVILCAGALLTPKLLLLAGIGPADHLHQVGIPCHHDLRAVGRNLHDHALLIGFNFATRRELPPLVANGFSSSCHLHTNPPSEAPNLQLITLHYAFASQTYGPREAYSVFPAVVKPTSRGRVLLASADPAAPPRIDPNYLATAADRAALHEGLGWALELGNARALRSWRRGTLIERDFAPDGVGTFIRQNLRSYLHYAGTCAFGCDPERSVLDAQNLQIWGVDGLRVADASAIPELPCVNTQAPV